MIKVPMQVLAPRLKPACYFLGLALLAATGAARAQSADTADNMFSFSGFGTIGMAHSSSSDGDYTANQQQPSGTGASHNWSPIDSKLAGQVTARVNDQLSAVVQVVAMTRTTNRFTPRVEWAFVKYAFTPELSVMVGRTVLPTFMSSETRLLGFSNPWVRPPLETYNQNPTTSLDGVNASFRKNFGSVTNTVQAFYGKNKAEIVTFDGNVLPPIKARPVRGLVDTLELGAWTVRASVSSFKLEINLAPGMTVTVPHFQQANLGVMYDSGDWFVQSELSVARKLMLTSDSRAFYATAGMRIKAFTPYLTWSQQTPSDSSFQGSVEQKTASAGLRWDAVKNVAIKAQFDHVTLGARSFGSFINVKPTLMGKGSNVASVVLDFVY